MWNRRHFVKTSLTAAGVVLCATTARAGVTRSLAPAGSIGTVLFDPRFGDSRAFAAELAGRGATAISVAEDIGQLWCGALRRSFMESAGALAGMTAHSDLLISRMFARDIARGRLIFEAQHDGRGARTLTHTFDMLDAEAGLAASIAESGSAWPTRLAQRLADSRHDSTARRREVGTGNVMAADHPGTLFSWIIIKGTA